MKTLPGIKMIGFAALVLTVAFAIAAGTGEQKKKHSKFLVKFGFSETIEDVLNCSDFNVEQIHAHLKKPDQTDEEVRKIYKIQQFNGENVTPDPEKGDLDICLPRSTAKPTPTPTAVAEASPSGTPKGAKTQTAGYVLFGNAGAAQTFADWVNGPTPTPTPTTTPKKK